jgi:hypothetical protein
MSVLVTTRSDDLPDDAAEDTADHLVGAPFPFPAANGKLVRLPTATAAPEQRVLSVEFRSPEGRHWHAIGGGDTVAEAIVFARESCPDDATWDIVGSEDLYGD